MADEDEEKSQKSSLAKHYHVKSDFSYSRPAYREARWERAAKVYTINLESKYLLVQGVPTVGATKELLEMFALYGPIQEYKILDDYSPREEFTEIYWIKYQKINNARYAKRKTDNRSFFGGILHVSYAPEFETVEETREKLQDRRKVIARKMKELYGNQSMESERNAQPHPSTSKSRQGAKMSQEASTLQSSPSVSSTAIPTCVTATTVTQTTDTEYQPSAGHLPHYPTLPPPPLPLHPTQYPPPPTPWELPKVPSANASLPLYIQRLPNPYLNPPPPPPPPPSQSSDATSAEMSQKSQTEGHCHQPGTRFPGPSLPWPPHWPAPVDRPRHTQGGPPPWPAQVEGPRHTQGGPVNIDHRSYPLSAGVTPCWPLQSPESSVERTVLSIRNKLKQVSSNEDCEPKAKKQRKRI